MSLRNHPWARRNSMVKLLAVQVSGTEFTYRAHVSGGWVWWPIYHCSLWCWRHRIPGASWLVTPAMLASSGFDWEICLDEKCGRVMEDDAWHQPQALTHEHTQVHVHPYLCAHTCAKYASKHMHTTHTWKWKDKQNTSSVWCLIRSFDWERITILCH